VPRVAVLRLGREQEHAELRAVETPGIRRVDPGVADVLGRIRRDPSVDVRKPIEPHTVEPAVNRRRRQPAFSIQQRNSSMWGRVTSRTAIALSAAHWKKPRRSCR
jgi:hypothetical protein